MTMASIIAAVFQQVVEGNIFLNSYFSLNLRSVELKNIILISTMMVLL